MKENQITPIEEIAKWAKHISLEALQDINARIADWLASGGKCDDLHVFQQLRYAKNFI